MVIGIKGTGSIGLQEFAVLTFEVVNEIGSPVPGETVRFALSTVAGGITLSVNSAVTDDNGQATVTVNSGNIPTPVRVTAEVDAPDGSGGVRTFATVSDELIITSGLPDQNSISLSAERLSARGGRDIDGVEVIFTVRLADQFNNPVPDGTQATFRTEYGAIEGGCVTTAGACSVVWTSQSPRVPDNDPSSGDLISRVTVVALGQESFIDRNGNGVMDQEESEGEFFPLRFNLPEAFVDNNDDGTYSPGEKSACPQPVTVASCGASGFEETFFDYDNNGAYDYNDQPPWYNGKLCPFDGDGVWCSRELVHVFDSQNLLLSSGAPGNFSFSPSGGVVREGSPITVRIVDNRGNPPVEGDTITVEGANGCTVISDTSITIGDTNSPGELSFSLAVDGEGDGETDNFATTGTAKVKLQTALGVTEVSYSCQTRGDPAPESEGAGSGSSSGSGLGLGGG